MQLYVWRMDGRGSRSFAVMAETLAQAREAVAFYIANDPGYDIDQWPDDYLSPAVLDAGQVVAFEND